MTRPSLPRQRTIRAWIVLPPRHSVIGNHTIAYPMRRAAEEWARFCDRYSDEQHRVIALTGKAVVKGKGKR